MNKMRLKDICLITSSKRIFEKEYVSEGIPFIRGQEITDRSLLKSNIKFECYISKKRFEEIKEKYIIPKKHDILITAVGTIGNVCYLDKDVEFYFKDGNILHLTNFNEKIYPLYLYYYMKSDFFHKQINVSMIGAVQKALTIKMLSDILIEIPSLNEQKKIATILSVIDKKIELNNKINDELEAMAKTIYDYWFLQFEFPNEEGKPYKSSGGKMVWNEELKREIPEGWTNGLISDLGEIISGGTPSTKHDEYYSKNGIAWVTPYDLSKTTDKYITHGEKDISQKGLEKSSAKLMPKGSILLTSRAPIGYIGISSNEVTTNQGFKSIVPYNKSNSEYIYYLLKSIIPYLKSLGNGSTFAEISKETLSNIPIVIPNKDIIDNFNNKVIHLGKIREIKEQENRELTSLRDFLLPLLMNGQVGFKEDKAEG